MSGERPNASSFDTSTDSGSLVEARFIPQRYEPNYPYPLLVLFHGSFFSDAGTGTGLYRGGPPRRRTRRRWQALRAGAGEAR